jgi:hypothetical protein
VSAFCGGTERSCKTPDRRRAVTPVKRVGAATAGRQRAGCTSAARKIPLLLPELFPIEFFGSGSSPARQQSREPNTESRCPAPPSNCSGESATRPDRPNTCSQAVPAAPASKSRKTGRKSARPPGLPDCGCTTCGIPMRRCCEFWFVAARHRRVAWPHASQHDASLCAPCR